jgi:hypothetical protein
VRGSADGIWFKSNDNNPSGGGHYIAGNTIIGGWDGIGGEEEGSGHGTFDRDATVENNTIQNTWDDCIQSEGGDQNVRIRNNDLSGCGTGIAFAAPVTGPLYVENNYVHDLVTGLYDNHFCYKVGQGSGLGTTYMTRNTCVVISAPGQEADGIHQTNENLSAIVSRGNVFNVSRYVFTLGYPSVPSGMDFDEDCIWSTNQNIIKWGSAYYASLASFQSATGQESRGQQTTNCSSQGTPTPTPTATATHTPTPPASAPDSDGDSLGVVDVYGQLVFRNTIEAFVGTNPYDACSGLGQDAWPPDLTHNAVVNIADAVAFRPHMGGAQGQPNYSPRFDLTANQVVNIADVLLMAPFMGQVCHP